MKEDLNEFMDYDEFLDYGDRRGSSNVRGGEWVQTTAKSLAFVAGLYNRLYDIGCACDKQRLLETLYDYMGLGRPDFEVKKFLDNF